MDLLSQILSSLFGGAQEDTPQDTPQAPPNVMNSLTDPMQLLPEILQHLMQSSQPSVTQGGFPPITRAKGSTPSPVGLPEGAYQYIPKFIQEATSAGIDPLRPIAHAWKESDFNPAAKNPTSSAGGIGQFIDSTAKMLNLKDRYNPEEAIPAMIKLLSMNYKQTGNWSHASRIYGTGTSEYARDIERRIALLRKDPEVQRYLQQTGRGG